LHSLDEILENGVVTDYDRMEREADLIKTYRKPSRRCEGVEEEFELFEVWVKPQQPDEEMIKELIEIGVHLDVIDDKTRIHNALQPWVYMDIVLRPLLNCLDADNPKLLTHLTRRILTPPSEQPYNWTQTPPVLSGQFAQPHFLDMVVFKGKVKNGFFVEAGADDFESDSNTVYFELKHNWSGILVEPNPTIYPVGLLKRRKAWGAGTCLGLTGRASIEHFAQKAVEHGMAGLVPEETEESFRVQCFPLYSLILATGNRTVNYLSLDIEGAELQVLKSIPWDKVDIEVLTVESNHMGEVFPGSQDELREYMKEQGYVLAYTVVIDDVFIRKDLYEGKYKPDSRMIERFEEKYSRMCHWEGDTRVQFYRVVTHVLHSKRKKSRAAQL